MLSRHGALPHAGNAPVNAPLLLLSILPLSNHLLD
jgi:hypothetical protein